MYVGGLFSDGAFPENSGITGQIADTQTGRNDFAETSKKYNPPIFIKAFYRGKICTAVSQITVRIVFRDDDTILICKCSDLFSAFQAQRPSGWILKRRNCLDHLWSGFNNQFFQMIRIQTFIIAGDRHKFCLIKFQALKIT